VSSVPFSITSYFRRRQLRPIIRSMTEDAAKTVIQAFISSHLDYCNSLLLGVADNLLQRLQSVQNAAAQLITRTGRQVHTTPILHSLPVPQRISSSGLSIYEELRGQLPQYLRDDCQLVTDISLQSLQSADSLTCTVQRSHTCGLITGVSQQL